MKKKGFVLHVETCRNYAATKLYAIVYFKFLEQFSNQVLVQVSGGQNIHSRGFSTPLALTQGETQESLLTTTSLPLMARIASTEASRQ